MPAPGIIRNDFSPNFYCWVIPNYSIWRYTVVSPDGHKVLGYFHNYAYLVHRLNSFGMGERGDVATIYFDAPGIGTSPGYYRAFVMYNSIYPQGRDYPTRPLANH